MNDYRRRNHARRRRGTAPGAVTQRHWQRPRHGPPRPRHKDPSDCNAVFNCYNNLFKGGSLGITFQTGAVSQPHWYVKDNLFDGANQSLSVDSHGNGLLSRSNNGSTSGTTDSTGGASDPTGLTADYQTGPLGSFYYPSSGSGDLHSLVDAGSRSASAAGLDAYTTQVSQTPDSGTVDIGYHYPIAPILGPSAFWDVTDDTTGQHLGPRQAPFGDPGYGGGCNSPQPPAMTVWYDTDQWTCTTTVYAPSATGLSFALCIDNYCYLYVNTHYVGYFHNDGCAAWTGLASLPYLNAGRENTIKAVISGDSDKVNYFSMVITSANCYSP